MLFRSDAGSAKLLAGLGFEALATTSAGFAFSLGRPDGHAALTCEETLENARSIVEATALPVSADLENGFGCHGLPPLSGSRWSLARCSLCVARSRPMRADPVSMELW